MLARAIHAHAELGDYIPAGLYLAVAKLLAYVFQLKAYQTGQGIKPGFPRDLTVPEELQVPAEKQDPASGRQARTYQLTIEWQPWMQQRF